MIRHESKHDKELSVAIAALLFLLVGGQALVLTAPVTALDVAAVLAILMGRL